MTSKNIQIGVVGASGKVGRENMSLGNAPQSNLSFHGIVSGSQESAKTYTSLAEADLEAFDILIDFSTPEATMTLLDMLATTSLPLVVGTTGFSQAQADRLQKEANRLPVFVGSNFTHGFEAFAKAAEDLITALPESDVTVGEVYHQHKKKAPSGTTQRLVKQFGAIPAKSGEEREINTVIERIGDTPGVNQVTLSLGFATYEVSVKIHSRQAYAVGAVEAAKWLLGKPAGFYTPADTL